MEEKTEATRIRIAYKISAKGVFIPDVTSEAETVETAIENLKEAVKSIKTFAKSEGVEVSK